MPLSAQELFDTVATALLKQGRPSMQTGNRSACMYRGPDDCKCAIGHLIPDEEYNSEYEFKSIAEVLQNFPIPITSEKIGGHGRLTRALQMAHDDAAFSGLPWLSSWKGRMATLASAEGLTLTPGLEA
jgi:hypothetical protein